jgi:uncharacterized protein
LNVLIGRTFMDIDRERAADILGIQRSGKAAFDETLRSLEPGQFYTLGPAISTKPELVTIGTVRTSHPESGGQISAKQPPTPEQVKSLLPKLADLPKGADEKAKTEAELRAQVRSLTAQLAARPKAEVDGAAIERAVAAARREAEQHSRQQQVVIEKLQARLQFIADKAAEAAGAPLPKTSPRVDVTVHTPKPVERKVITPFERRAAAPSNGNGHLPKGEAHILRAIAQYPDGSDRVQISILTGYKRSTRDRYLQYLAEKGLVDTRGSLIVATQAGIDALGSDFEPLPTGSALLEHWLNKLPEGERKLLQVVAASPDGVLREQLDEATGYKRSTRDRYLQYLQARKLIDADGRGVVRPSGILFD